MKAASRILIGILLVGIIWYVSACVIVFVLGYGLNNNPIAADHGTGNTEFLASICTILFIIAYSWKIRRNSKAIFGMSILVTVGVLSYYGYQYSLIRSEQQKVLIKYQAFRQALLEEDYQSAYLLMAPRWRAENSVNDVKAETEGFLSLGPEDSIHSVHIYSAMGYLDLEAQAEIVPSPHTSWWYREAVGDSWWFEKIDSEWYVSPEYINFYMSWLRS
ncbi:MAG: hypothetical protein AB1607_07235 [Chloroflexota bacterium]